VHRSASSSFADPSAGHDAALPGWITPELIAETLTTWQPYYPEPLTNDDAVEMLLTIGNLYRVLAGVDREEPSQEAISSP
jgi:hypothetical protein